MITKETIKEFFENVKRGGEFDTTNKLLWGYFFLDKDISKLKNIVNELSKEGYRYVDIFEAEKLNPDDVQEYYLHVEKIEYHDIDSLDIRNRELYNFADKLNTSYDGFDVGNVITSQNIIR